MPYSNVLKEANSQINSFFLLILLPPTFLLDYKITTRGLHCVFRRNIREISEHLTVFLSSFTDLTGECLYFEVINAKEAILKLYHIDGLRFQDYLIFSQNKYDNSKSLEDVK